MKVFFTGSPRALNTLKTEHEAIFKAIENNGGVNLSRLVIEAQPEAFYEVNHPEVVKHYQRTMSDLKKSDILVAEVSTHSMSMGFLINKALEQNKFVLALYLPDHKPFFLSGIENDKLLTSEYTKNNIEKVIKEAFDRAVELTDTRFNFYISPEIGRYLDWISQHKKLPRAVFLRSLLEKSMKSEKDFES